MKRLLVLLCAAACASTGQGTYLDDAHARRATLEASLVNPQNGYSMLRLAHYSTGKSGDWDSLPVWNPASEPLTASTLATPTAPLSADATPIAIQADLQALGQAAFFRYPVQLAPAATQLVTNDAAVARYGLWSDAAHGIGGLVRVRVFDGSTQLAYTCSTCHSSQRGGSLLVGMTNATFDLGKMIADSSLSADPRYPELVAWGPGRVDVTTMAATEPVRIPDLRPVRALTHLHHTASVEQKDLSTLAIRLETLVVVSSSQTVRPPREIALALATYVWSLGDTLSTRAPSSDAEVRGQSLFTSRCSSCHAPPGYTGAPVPIGVVGTDPTVGLSADRSTGTYRVPSLLGVGDRQLLLHDASASSLDEMFDPARTGSGYHGRLGGPIQGHTYGLDLGADDRSALLAFLRTL